MEDTRSLIVHTEYGLRAYKGKLEGFSSVMYSKERVKVIRHLRSLGSNLAHHLLGALEAREAHPGEDP